VTLEELSKKIGLSTATISRALNDASNVTEETKRFVLESAEKYGYEPKTKRTTTKDKNSDTVMVITGSLSNPVHLNLVLGIEGELSKNNKHSVVMQTNYREDLQTQYLEYAKDAEYSCIMLLNAIENKHLIKFLKKPSNPPILFVNRALSSIETDSITMDNYRSGQIAAKKLVENGHSRIMIISGPEDSTVCRDRINGFRHGIEEYGLSFNEKAIYHGNRSYAFGYSIGESIAALSEDIRPTAIYSLNGTMAGGFIDAFKTHGLSVPHDISIICNDNPNNYYAEKMSISSIEIDFHKMGSVAAQRYLEIISNKDKVTKQIMFMPTIYERNSIKYIKDEN